MLATFTVFFKKVKARLVDVEGIKLKHAVWYSKCSLFKVT